MRDLPVLSLVLVVACGGSDFEQTGMMQASPDAGVDAPEPDAAEALDAPGGSKADATISVDAAADTHDAPPPKTCPSAMVWSGVGCIDRAEVTERAFYGGGPELPVTNVSWQQAWEYCALVDKRLCGAPDGTDGTISGASDPSRSEWFAACSSMGERHYPYGDTYNASACQTEAEAPTYVGTHPECTTTAGALDMSGNVWEWTNECDATHCLLRGGSFLGVSPLEMACAHINDSQGKNWTGSHTTGFRCCADGW